MRLLLLQHLPHDTPPDAYATELAAQGVEIVSVRPEEGEAIPPLDGLDGIVATGGPVSVYDEERNPWLREEKAAIAAAVRAGTPYWGVCLGAQLLAASLGAEVRAGPRPEIGVEEVSLLPAAGEDPVFAGCPSSFRSFEWHRDGFDLPAGATPLAASSLYPNQGFSWGAAYGVQFHLEATVEAVRFWLSKPAYDEAEAKELADRARLLADVTEVAPDATGLARALLARWLRLVEEGGFAPTPSTAGG